MSQSLSEHLQTLLEDSVQLLSLHKRDLEKEWGELRCLLVKMKKKQIEVYDFLSSFLLNFFRSSQKQKQHSDISRMFWRLQEEWLESFLKKPDPENFMFYINLLENTAHKVLKARIAYSSQLHPSVHYLFSKISEVMLYQRDQDMLPIDEVCHYILNTPGTSINWIAKIEEKNGTFIIKKLFGKNPHYTEQAGQPFFRTWYELINVLYGKNDPYQSLPILWEEQLLLFGAKNPEEHSRYIPLVFSILQAYQLEDEKRYAFFHEAQWKDAVILFNEWIIRSQNFNESIENICFGFGYFLPFERCALFKISSEDQTGIGLYGHSFNTEEIQAVTEKITSFPTLNESLVKLASQGMEMKNFQPIFIQNAQEEFPKRYVQKFQLGSLIIVPIYVPVEGKIIGGVILDQGPAKEFSVDRSLFPALIKFGQSSGELLSKFIEAELPKRNVTAAVTVAPREMEILKLLAEGASTAEAALKLYLSEYTVRDYISTLMKRLNARNRTEMVAKALRMKLIQ